MLVNSYGYVWAPYLNTIAPCLFRYHKETVVVVHVEQAQYVLTKNLGPFLFVFYSLDALACFARFTLKAIHRPPIKAHMTSCDYGFRYVLRARKQKQNPLSIFQNRDFCYTYPTVRCLFYNIE